MKSLTRKLGLLLVLIYVSTSYISSGNVNKGSNGSVTSYTVHVDSGWNLMSLPVEVSNGTKSVLFPTAVSPAFAFQDSYIPKDSLEPGVGYWMQFSSSQELSIEGDTLLDRAIPVRAGWNMIGSLSVPMPIDHIYSEPEGIISSKFFRYAGGSYQVADTLQPVQGHWVQVQQDGTLFLTAPGGAEGPIGDSARSVILDSINAFVNRLPHINDGEDNLTLLSYLRSIPQFEASDTTLGGVWARFTDGRMYMRVSAFRRPDSSTIEYSSGIIPALGESEHPMSPMHDLPTSSTAWVCNALGSYFDFPPANGATQTTISIQQWLTLAGYTPASNSGASVGRLKNVSNVGIFYINTHGGWCKDPNNNVVYAVWTATEQHFLFDLIFRRDLDDGSVVYLTAPHDVDPSGGYTEETHYGITSRFVQKYMNFQKSGAVYIDACWGHYNGAFAATCLGKGAGFYMGWTRPVGNSAANRAARHFFDRMLGTNKFFPEYPPQRPFDADLVWNDLILKGYDTSRTRDGLSKFQVDPVIPRTNLLAPSILMLEPPSIPGDSHCYIHGLFSQDARPDVSVKVGNASLNITEWDSTKLTLEPPLQGGNVQVTIRGRKSNVTQYTEWHAVFDYTLLGRGTLKKHIVFNVNFLADVHKFRINIANPPIYGPGPRYIQVLNTSHATYECSGEYKNPKDTAIVEEFWTGSGDVPIGTDFTFSTVIYDIGNPFGMYLGFTAPYSNTGYPAKLTIELGLDQITTSMTSLYSFAAGSKSGSYDTNTAEISWGEITPIYPPDPNGAR